MFGPKKGRDVIYVCVCVCVCVCVYSEFTVRIAL
jgi:hypothetical protein